MKKLILLATTVSLAIAATSTTIAQTYPSRPITIVVGTPPGGTNDVIARLYARQIEKELGQSAIVENRTGAGGAIAIRAVARSPADGHLLTVAASALHSLFMKEPGYDLAEIVPVTVMGNSRYGLIVSKKREWKNLTEFVAHAKANPGKVNFGTVPLTGQAIEVDNVQHVLGVKGTVVPYKGIADIYRALVGGEIDATIHSNSPQVQQGLVLALAMGGKERAADSPNLPTFGEMGYDFAPAANFIVFARSGTPNATLERLAAIAGQTSRSAEFRDQVTKPYGIAGVTMPHRETVAYMASELQRMQAGANRAGIVPK